MSEHAKCADRSAPRGRSARLVLGLVALGAVVVAQACAANGGGKAAPDAGDGAVSGDGDQSVDVIDPGDAGGPGDGGDGGETGDGGGPAPQPVALTDYCATTADSYHRWLQKCYGLRGYPDSERDAFVQRIESRCANAGPAVEAGRLSYDGVQAARCLATIDVQQCAQQFLAQADCSGIFAGQLAQGDECYVEESLVFMVGVSACADGYCDDDAQCPGRCAPYAQRGADCAAQVCAPVDFCGAATVCEPRAEQGESCEGRGCLEGLLCIGEGTPTCLAPVTNGDDPCDGTHPCGGPSQCIDGRCTASSSLGEPCIHDGNCPDGSACLRLPGAEASCAAPQDAGEPCSFDRDCGSGLLCDRGAAVCFVPPAAGQPCADGVCAAGSWCQYGGGDVDGTCRVLGDAGSDCGSNGFPSYEGCNEGLFCTEALACAPPGTVGDPCNISETLSCLDGLWCSRATGQCVAPAAEGQPCNPLWPATCVDGQACDCGLEDRNLCGGTPRQAQPSDTCQPQLDDGDPCFRLSECASRDCVFDFDAAPSVAGVCVSPQPLCLP